MKRHMKRRAQKPPHRVTLHDVAAAANVSLMTVSNVVNQRFQYMREDTRRRVQREIERLGYRPHSTARSLRSQRRLSVGLLIVNDSPLFLSDGFSTRVMAGLSKHLADRGYGLLVQGTSREEFDRSIFMRDARTDGMCALLSGSRAERTAQIERLMRFSEPLVLVGESLEETPDDVCVVRQDDYAGGRAIGEHLLEQGARHFVFLGTRVEHAPLKERERGLRAALRRVKAHTSVRTVRCQDPDFGDAQAMLAAHLEAQGLPDAVVGANDRLASAALKLLRARGVNVPERVRITGFDGFEVWQHAEPSLTTVRSPAYEIGARAGEELLRRLREGRFAAPSVVFPVTLQIGGTTVVERAPRRRRTAVARVRRAG